MNFQSILTILALMIALYNILPKHRKQVVFLKFTYLDYIITFLVVLTVHYSLFYSLIVKLKLNPALNLRQWGVTNENFTYTLILCWAIFIYLRYRFSTLPRYRIKNFHALIEELTIQNNYSELISNLKDNLGKLIKIAEGRFVLRKFGTFFAKKAKFVDKITPDLTNEDIEKFLKSEIEKQNNSIKDKLKNYFRTILLKTSSLFPRYSTEIDAARDIFRIIFLKHNFAEAIKNFSPYFGIELFNLKVPGVEEFKNNYFESMILDNKSVLFFELKNNKNISSRYRYNIEKSNKLLYYLFHDIRNSESISVWSPIGHSVSKHLDELYKFPESDIYNLPIEDFIDVSCWESPIYVGITFFDIMVSEAIYQNIKWHMWLNFYQTFTKRICRNYNPDSNIIDTHEEFPTKYDYILYEMVSNLLSWIKIIEYIEPNQENTILTHIDVSQENGNIIKTAILTLGLCIFEIAVNKKLSLKIKDSILHKIFDLFFELNSINGLSNFTEILTLSIIHGGNAYRNPKENHIGEVIRSFLEYDTFHQPKNSVNIFFETIVKQYVDCFELNTLNTWVNIEDNRDHIKLTSKQSGRAQNIDKKSIGN